MKALKSSIVMIAILGLGTALAPAFAETRPVTKAPEKSMGDQGELPATSTMGSHVPNMGSTDTPATIENGAKRLGDEGKLPATGTMGNQVPPMRGEDK